MSNCNSTLRARRGVSFVRSWRWCTGPLIYKAVSDATSLTPLTLTVTAHGVTDGASVAFADLGGLDSVNVKEWLTGPDYFGPSSSDYYPATVVDADTLLFDTVDAARTGDAYTGGGKIVYATPVDLSTISGVAFHLYAIADPTTAVMTKDCALDNTAKTISLEVAPADVAALTDDEYTWNLLATATSDGAITLLDDGTFNVDPIGAQ